MKSPFSLEGELRRPAYAIASMGVFFSQHLFALLAFVVSGEPLKASLEFWLNPLRAMAFGGHSFPPPVLLLAMTITVIADWLLVALAFRRIPPEVRF